MSPRLAFALDAAHKAGRSTLALFNTGVDVQQKQDETPVTQADKGAEALLRKLIGSTYPEDAILGEEEGETGSGSGRWVIDPIDGTKSFVCGVPLYATLLSYEVEGRTVLGVCYMPAIEEMVYAESGSGAFWNGRPCRVSARATISGGAISCGSHYSLKKYGRMDGFLVLADRAMASRTWSDAYGHALVATGRIEAMMDPIVNPWDISAMSLIVREAGGRFTDFQGRETPAAEAVSSNGLVHDEVLEAFLP
jgi:histidinol-phosphatase